MACCPTMKLCVECKNCSMQEMYCKMVEQPTGTQGILTNYGCSEFEVYDPTGKLPQNIKFELTAANSGHRSQEWVWGIILPILCWPLIICKPCFNLSRNNAINMTTRGILAKHVEILDISTSCVCCQSCCMHTLFVTDLGGANETQKLMN